MTRSLRMLTNCPTSVVFRLYLRALMLGRHTSREWLEGSGVRGFTFPLCHHAYFNRSGFILWLLFSCSVVSDSLCFFWGNI